MENAQSSAPRPEGTRQAGQQETCAQVLYTGAENLTASSPPHFRCHLEVIRDFCYYGLQSRVSTPLKVLDHLLAASTPECQFSQLSPSTSPFQRGSPTVPTTKFPPFRKVGTNPCNHGQGKRKEGCQVTGNSATVPALERGLPIFTPLLQRQQAITQRGRELN